MSSSGAGGALSCVRATRVTPRPMCPLGDGYHRLSAGSAARTCTNAISARFHLGALPGMAPSLTGVSLADQAFGVGRRRRQPSRLHRPLAAPLGSCPGRRARRVGALGCRYLKCRLAFRRWGVRRPLHVRQSVDSRAQLTRTSRRMPICAVTPSLTRLNLHAPGARVEGRAVVAETPLSLTPVAAAALQGRADVVRSVESKSVHCWGGAIWEGMAQGRRAKCD